MNSTNNASGWFGFALFLLVAAGGIGWAMRKWIAAQRLQWELFARDEHLYFYDGNFPKSFSWRDMFSLPFFHRTRFCVAGERHGEEVIVFQYRSFLSRSGWSTAVGCRQQNPETYHKHASLLVRDTYEDGWRMRSSRYPIKLGTDEVLNAWDSLATVRHEGRQVLSQETVIHPRHATKPGDN